MNNRCVPDCRVWVQGREYVEAAEILLDYNRLQSAVILSALAIELFLKSFISEQTEAGRSIPKRGHSFVDLYGAISQSDQDDLMRASSAVDPTVQFATDLNRFDGLFTKARYQYEPDAPRSLSSDVIYFSRHLCESVFALGKDRER